MAATSRPPTPGRITPSRRFSSRSRLCSKDFTVISGLKLTLLRRPRRRSHLPHRHQHAQRRLQAPRLVRSGTGPGHRPADAVSVARARHQARHRLRRLSGPDPLLDAAAARRFPSENRPHVLFDQLFRPDTAADAQPARSGVHPPGQRARFAPRRSTPAQWLARHRRPAQARRIPHRHPRPRTPHAG